MKQIPSSYIKQECQELELHGLVGVAGYENTGLRAKLSTLSASLLLLRLCPLFLDHQKPLGTQTVPRQDHVKDALRWVHFWDSSGHCHANNG